MNQNPHKDVKKVLRYLNSRAQRIETIVLSVDLDTGEEIRWSGEMKPEQVITHLCFLVDAVATWTGIPIPAVLEMIGGALKNVELEAEVEDE